MEDDTKFSSYANPKLSTALVNARKLALSARNFRWRRLLDASFAVEGGKKTYITYRSCIPPVNEEKLGVLGFEVRKVVAKHAFHGSFYSFMNVGHSLLHECYFGARFCRTVKWYFFVELIFKHCNHGKDEK